MEKLRDDRVFVVFRHNIGQMFFLEAGKPLRINKRRNRSVKAVEVVEKDVAKMVVGDSPDWSQIKKDRITGLVVHVRSEKKTGRNHRVGGCPRMPFRSLRLPSPTLRYLEKIMLGILPICLCLFFQDALI